MVPVIKVNAGAKQHGFFESAFSALIKEKINWQEKPNKGHELDDDFIALSVVSDHDEQRLFMRASKKIENNKEVHVNPNEIAKMFSTHSPHTLSVDQKELLSIHERLNHQLSIKDVQLLADAGYFPKWLANCCRPQCFACQFGKSQKKPWRSRAKDNKRILEHVHRIPGSLAHADIMTSSVGGIIPQMTGFLTRQKYYHAHFFVDDVSDLTFVYHAKSTDISEALEAKAAYEREACKHGKKVNHIHADNGTCAC